MFPAMRPRTSPDPERSTGMIFMGIGASPAIEPSIALVESAEQSSTTMTIAGRNVCAKIDSH